MNNEEKFDQILDEAIHLLQKGKPLSEILALFPEYTNELKELLDISNEIVVEKNISETKNIFQNVLQSLDSKSLSQTTDKDGYRYHIKERIIGFLHNHSFMKYSHAFVPVGLVVVVIWGGSLLIKNHTSLGGQDDWGYDTYSSYPEILPPRKYSFLQKIVLTLFPDKFTAATSISNTPGNMVTQPASVMSNDTFGMGKVENSAPTSYRADAEIGFAAGGAKDINNFRENIKNGYLPIPSDITYEGLFSDYYFDTGKKQKCDKLFCPSYATALSKDPISGQDEYYLSVGLNSNLTQKDFQRKKLNLVVVLDISGSMESPFDEYYYDKNPVKKFIDGEYSTKPKIEITKKAVAELTTHLKSDDRFGMVLFDDQAYLAKPLSTVSETNMDKIRDHIQEIKSQGGTNMSAGLKMGTELFDEVKNSNPDEYENRIIFLTDAQPNTGDISRGGLSDMTKKNAEEKIYNTFIGIGVDFNTDLIESITKIRGANYYSVHSDEEFKTQLDDNFEFMVTPLVFNLSLDVQTQGFQIEKIYGSPEADEGTGNIMKVNTLFPSPTKNGETKGGIILLKLKKTQENGSLHLKVGYENRTGQTDTSESLVEFNKTGEYADNTGIRKGILLARYANLLKDWTVDERSPLPVATYDWNEENTMRVNEQTGISLPPETMRSEWERASVPLKISPEYKTVFQKFSTYFETEQKNISDNTLTQEKEILNTLSR